jgi:hypothetical protein
MQYLTAEERATLVLERRLRSNGIKGAGSLSPWLVVVVAVAVLFWSFGAWAAAGTCTLTFPGYGGYTANVVSDSCSDVRAGWDAYAASNQWNDRFTSCSSDPVQVGTTLTATVSGVVSATGITATATGTTTPPANGDPVVSGMPTTISAVDHVSFAYGIMAVCFCIGFGIGVRL